MLSGRGSCSGNCEGLVNAIPAVPSRVAMQLRPLLARPLLRLCPSSCQKASMAKGLRSAMPTKALSHSALKLRMSGSRLNLSALSDNRNGVVAQIGGISGAEPLRSGKGLRVCGAKTIWSAAQIGGSLTADCLTGAKGLRVSSSRMVRSAAAQWYEHGWGAAALFSRERGPALERTCGTFKASGGLGAKPFLGAAMPDFGTRSRYVLCFSSEEMFFLNAPIEGAATSSVQVCPRGAIRERFVSFSNDYNNLDTILILPMSVSEVS